MGLYNRIVTEYIGEGPLLMHDETMESFCAIEAPAVTINEGLIKTYPIEDSVATFGRIFHLYIGENQKACRKVFERIKDGDTDYDGTICIRSGATDDGKRIEMILGDGEYIKV